MSFSRKNSPRTNINKLNETGKRKKNSYEKNENCQLRFSGRRISHVWSFYFIFLFLTMQLPQTSPKELQEMICNFLRYQEECKETLKKNLDSFSHNEIFCQGEFDNFACWPHSKPGVVNLTCPSYFEKLNETAYTQRYCREDGTWHIRTETNETWINYIQCSSVYESEWNQSHDEANNVMFLLDVIRVAYTIGYSISLFCLIIALIIFTYFRKLHCTRNYIHINLMLSFVVRYIAILIKDRVMEAHYNMDQFDNLNDEELKNFCDKFNGVSGLMVGCRLAMVFTNYGILANYFWLLAEGIYLQALLMFAMTANNANNHFPLYMAGGWGGPWIFVGVWAVLMLTLENEECWERYDSKNYQWILRAPVILSIAMNFIVFINVIRLIVSKLRANNLNRNDYKLTLAKSTLALIPLLGIHYIVFFAITDDVVESGNPLMNVKLGFEMIFTSIQGMLIAVFYCFLNGEVRGELIKCWKNIRLKNGLPTTTFRKGSTIHTNQTQLSTLMMPSDDKNHLIQETSLLSPNSHARILSKSICSETTVPLTKSDNSVV